MNRRDLLLNEMKITQWVLRKPQVLKGEAQIRLEPSVKLIVICDENHQTSQLFSDILLAMSLNHTQYQWLNLEQAMRLHLEQSAQCWLIHPAEQAVKFCQKFAKHEIWQHNAWQDLTQSPQKRQLWQHIQHFLAQTEENA